MISIKKFIRFLKDVNIEMKKVRWEPKTEVVKDTAIVIAAVIILAIFFSASDYLISLVENLFFG